MAPKLPQQTNTESLGQFLTQAEQLPQRQSSAINNSGRIIFALDATASRQPNWDRACHLQAQMFSATDNLGGLQLQLCYYRGINEFYASHWLQNSQAVLSEMSTVSCLGGYTQIQKVLNHSLQQQNQQSIHAVIIIGDAVEENIDKLCGLAGQLGIVGVPLFMFQEGSDPSARQCFQQMAHVSNGAYATFDEHSADQLAELLRAVATFASGGVDALQKLPTHSAQQLLQQLKG